MSTRKTKAAAPAELSIGKLSKELGISTATIHFYIAQGLLPRPRKVNRTRALYGQSHLRLARMIRKMQAVGLPLAFIKGVLQKTGDDEQALAKLEKVGYLQPLPRPRNDPEQQPIEPFDPVDRATFLDLARTRPEVLDHLESWGLLRPRQPGRYDARDLWLVRNVQSLLGDGIALEQLALHDHLLPLVRAVAPLSMQLVDVHRDELRDRRLRFTEMMAPFVALLGYVADRVKDELYPDWRGQLWGLPDDS